MSTDETNQGPAGSAGEKPSSAGESASPAQQPGSDGRKDLQPQEFAKPISAAEALGQTRRGADGERKADAGAATGGVAAAAQRGEDTAFASASSTGSPLPTRQSQPGDKETGEAVHRKDAAEPAGKQHRKVKGEQQGKPEQKAKSGRKAKAEHKLKPQAAAGAATRSQLAAKETAQSSAAPRKRPVRVALGVLGGLGVLVLGGAAVAGATVLPTPHEGRTFTPPAAQLPAGQSVSVCQAPPQLLQGSSADTDPQFKPGSDSARTAVNALVGSNAQGAVPASSLNSLAPDGKGNQLAKITDAKPAQESNNVAKAPSQVSFTALNDSAITSAAVLRADPIADARTANGGVALYSAKDGDLRGLAGASCLQPGNDSWLIGASTQVGRTAVLHLVNPSSSPATVNLSLFGDAGRVQSPGTKDLLISPGTDKAIVLAGLAPDQKNLSVHVQSSGAAITSSVTQSVLRGLTSGGVDYLTGAAVPGTHQVIPGVVTIDPQTAKDISGQGDYQDAQTALKVTVPTPNDSIIQVKVFGASGQVALPNGGVFTAKGNATSELPLSGLPAGQYSVELTADAGVLASVRSVVGTKPGEPTDLAYTPAAAPLTDNQLLTLTGDPSSKLVLSAPAGDATVNVTPIGAHGKTGPAKKVTVNAGKTLVLNKSQLGGDQSRGALLSATGSPVYGAQTVTGLDGSGVSVLSIPGAVASQPSVSVGLGY